jgi:hypothetical protein
MPDLAHGPLCVWLATDALVLGRLRVVRARSQWLLLLYGCGLISFAGLSRKYARGVNRVIADKFSVAISLDLVGLNATREVPVRELPQADLGQGQDTRRSYIRRRRSPSRKAAVQHKEPNNSRNMLYTCKLLPYVRGYIATMEYRRCIDVMLVMELPCLLPDVGASLWPAN